MQQSCLVLPKFCHWIIIGLWSIWVLGKLSHRDKAAQTGPLWHHGACDVEHEEIQPCNITDMFSHGTADKKDAYHKHAFFAGFTMT